MGLQGPRVVWRKNVGQGFSGPVVAQGRIILFHRVANEEVVEALDPRTGATNGVAHTTSYRDDFGFDEGPRAVPVIANGIAYIRCARAVACHRPGQGHAGVERRYGAAIPCPERILRCGWITTRRRRPGSRQRRGPECGIVAFDAKTGQALWTATNDEASYSSAAGATIAGRRVAIFLTRAGLVGLDPASGKVQFQRPWRARMAASVNVATPLVIGDLLFVSAEHGPGAGVFRLDGTTLNQLWASDEVLTNHYATSVHYDGNLYGFHGRQEFGQSFRAVELRTGKVRWNQDRFLAGTVTLAGDRLVILRERGELVLAPATPEGFKPLARAQVLSGTVRAYPALSDGFLYARNENTLICLDLRRQQ